MNAGIMATKKPVIEVRGARVNNLKNVSVDVPRDALVVITGLSGSGKSSFAFDTLYAEANRRYVESLSSYARNFMEAFDKPDVDAIHNLIPAISIDQKSVSRSPRSTVGTMTEIYDYLRLLFVKEGVPHCPLCAKALSKKTSAEILDELLLLPPETLISFVAAPEAFGGKSTQEKLIQAREWGYLRVRVNGVIMSLEEAGALSLSNTSKASSSVAVVIDRLVIDRERPDKERILDSLETAFRIGNGSITVLAGDKEYFYKNLFLCDECHVSFPDFTPSHFSFNSPLGACSRCSGLGVTLEFDPERVIPNKNLSVLEGALRPLAKTGGERGNGNGPMKILEDMAKRNGISLSVPIKKLTQKQLHCILFGEGKKGPFPGIIAILDQKYREVRSDHFRAELEECMVKQLCGECGGKRLKPESLSVLVEGHSIFEISKQSVAMLQPFFRDLSKRYKESSRKVTDIIFREIDSRLAAVEKVGLGYLDLSRGADTLSGGEAQRIRLAVQLRSGLSGILYVLDEPSVGLHSRDTDRLIDALLELRRGGNSLVVVEHDRSIMKRADYVIDFGPGAGERGGEIIFSGTPEKLLASKSITGNYLSSKRQVSNKDAIRPGNGKHLSILGATENNLKNIDVHIPLGMFVAVAGVSGSGKSSLVDDILSRVLAAHFYGALAVPGAHASITGLEHIDKVITVNQDPIGRTPRSNAATYTGVFNPIRELFAETAEAIRDRFSASHFSFNMKGGRCETCQGAGMKKIEMYLLPDMYAPCETCGGSRYNQKTLSIEWRGMNISEVLALTVSKARTFFLDQPAIEEKLRALEEVGLGYLVLGQSAPTLSGGEAQRVKLATELSRKSSGNTLYILDEPTIGLHFEDARRLLDILDALVDKGNTVLVVEHNIDVIRHADWVIELGPDGGSHGGELIFSGVPNALRSISKSPTAKYL